MIAVLLLILKILGIILLVLLGLILLLLMIVLLVPIRYQLAGKYNEEEMQASGKVTWLLSIVRVNAEFDGKKPKVWVRILYFLNIYVVPSKEEMKRMEEEAKQAANQTANQAADQPAENAGTTANTDASVTEPAVAPAQNEALEETSVQNAENAQTPAVVQPSESAAAAASMQPPASDQAAREPEQKKKLFGGKNKDKDSGAKPDKQAQDKEPILIRIMEKITDVIGAIANVPCTLFDIYDRIRTKKIKVDDILDFIRSDTFCEAFALCKDKILSLLAALLPKKVEGFVDFGLDDPATTGQLYGIACVLVTKGRFDLQVTPYFEEKVMRADVRMNGRFRLIRVVIAGIQLIFDKNVRMLIKKFLKR